MIKILCVIKILGEEVHLLLAKKVLETSWPMLAEEFNKPYMQELRLLQEMIIQVLAKY